jgi:putative ABC transport system permease protein
LLALTCATLVFSLYGLGFGLTEALRRTVSVAPVAFSQQLQVVSTVVSLIGIALILLLIAGATAQSVRLRMQEFGILKAIGFSHRRIITLVIAEAATPCVAGAFLGLLIAPFLFLALTNALPPLATLPMPKYSIGIIGGVAAIAVLVPALSCVLPVLRLVRLNPAAALNGSVAASMSASPFGRNERRGARTAEAPQSPSRQFIDPDADTRFLRQIAIVCQFGLSTLRRRLKGSLLVVAGVGCVTFVLLYFLSMAEGIRGSILESGDPSRVVLRSASTTWLHNSRLPEGVANIAAAAPGVARFADGSPMAEPLLHDGVGLDKRSGGRAGVTMLIGASPDWHEMMPSFRLLSGRLPEPGSRELLAGHLARKAFSELDQGAITHQEEEWQIVGTFSTDSWWNGYLVGDHDAVRSTKGSSGASVLVRLESPQAFEAFQASVARRLPPNVTVERETDYYAGFWKSLPKPVLFVAYVLSGLLALGVITGVAQLIHGALEERRREIAILRIFGFDGRAVAVAVALESLAFAVLGSLAGSTLVWVLMDGKLHSGAWSVFEYTVNVHLVLVAMGWASAIALLGGLPTALRTAREAEREALLNLREASEAGLCAPRYCGGTVEAGAQVTFAGCEGRVSP